MAHELGIGAHHPVRHRSAIASGAVAHAEIASRREQDYAKRAELYRAADSLAYFDAPMVPLFFYNDLYGVQPWIRDFQVPTIFNGQRWIDVKIVGPEQGNP